LTTGRAGDGVGGQQAEAAEVVLRHRKEGLSLRLHPDMINLQPCTTH
jgi:hypothetical protein